MIDNEIMLEESDTVINGVSWQERTLKVIVKLVKYANMDHRYIQFTD